MPRYVYRLQPALAVAFTVAYRPGEWAFSVEARSEAVSVEIGLSPAQADGLRADILSTATADDGGRFPLARVRAPDPDDPLLRVPRDLEARADEMTVVRDPRRRIMLLCAKGCTEGAPYEVTVAGTPEQMLAMAEQIAAARSRAATVCPVCGRKLPSPGRPCPHRDAEGVAG